MKSLLYRDPITSFEFVMKFKDEDIEGLLDIAVDNGELNIQDKNQILAYLANEQYSVIINHNTIFEVCDHDAPRNIDSSSEEGYGLGLPSSFDP